MQQKILFGYERGNVDLKKLLKNPRFFDPFKHYIEKMIKQLFVFYVMSGNDFNKTYL